MNAILMSLVTSLLAGQIYAATATSSANQTVAPSASSAAKISAPITAVAPTTKKVTVSYVAETSVGSRAANVGNYDGFNAQQHLGVAYDLGNDRKIQVRQYFYYNATDRTKTDETTMGDHVVQYTDAKAVKIGSADVTGIARLYLPGTAYAQDVGAYELRLYGITEQKFTSKLSAEYLMSVRGYAYSQDASGQLGLRAMPAIKVAYEASSLFAPYASVFTDSTWRNTGRGRGFDTDAKTYSRVNGDLLYSDIGFTTALNKNLNLNFYVESAKDLRKAGSFNVLNENSSEYNLTLSASM